MKAIIPRGFKQLKPSDQKKIMELADEQIGKNSNIMLDIYLKMSCAVLNEAFGFGEERLNRYLGNYRRIFRKHVKLVKNGEQNEFLDSKMRKIFRKKGYPDEFFKTMITGWDIDTKDKTAEKYVKATECADIISEQFDIPFGDLVDAFADIPGVLLYPKEDNDDAP